MNSCPSCNVIVGSQSTLIADRTGACIVVRCAPAPPAHPHPRAAGEGGGGLPRPSLSLHTRIAVHLLLRSATSQHHPPRSPPRAPPCAAPQPPHRRLPLPRVQFFVRYRRFCTSAVRNTSRFGIVVIFARSY